MARTLHEVVFVDGVRTPFGRAGEKGIFWKTRADELVVKVIRELIKRNPKVEPASVDDNIWAATTQIGDQGLTMGRTTVLLSGLPKSVPGFSVDRMCAGAMTAVCCGAGEIATGSADVIIAGGVEHMGHHPMGEGVDPNPRIVAEKIVDPSALNMGNTAENLHDRQPDVTKERCDTYSVNCQNKAEAALKSGKLADMIVPMTVWSADGWKLADKDEQPRPATTMESLAGLRTPFRAGGRVTAGNSSGLNDGACGCIITSEEKAKELGLKAKMRFVSFGFAGVEPEIMGYGPIPSTEKALKKAGLTIDDIGLIEMNEAFAVQAVAFLDHFGLALDDPKVNPYGGAIAYGHPLASSGVRLMIHLAHEFAEHPEVRYGLATMCIGLGMGGTVIWENLQTS
ncbi:MAG: thiolase family protein [Actinomycetota bacterium]